VADVAVGVAPVASCGLLLLLPLVWLFLFVLSVDELETSERAVSSLLRSGGGVAYMDAAILDDITAGERWRGRNIVVENFLIEVEAMLAGGFTLTKRDGILGLFICMYEHKV